MKKKSPKRPVKRPKSKRSAKKSKQRSPYRIEVSGLKKNSLAKYGYSSSKGVRARHIALGKAVKAYGPHVVWNKLNVVGILNKNRSPTTSAVFIQDKNWVKLKFIKT